METIKLSEFNWIKSNSDLFKKYLYYQYDFQGNKITHISVKINTTDGVSKRHHWLINIELYKAGIKFPWFTINSSGGIKDRANVYLSKIYDKRKQMHEPKEVRWLKEQYVEGSFEKLFKQIKRDNLLNDILQ